MHENIFEVMYAGNPVRYSFLNRGTRYLFRSYIKKADPDQTYDLRVNEELMEQGRRLLPADSTDSYVEYRLLIPMTSKFLLRYQCCIFHCVSFVYKGFAWLLSAPSGTGKTTQYLNWQELFPDEIKMISGDMPVLQKKDDSHIFVHPTSWNGKEKIGNKISAPLGGIIYLEQDSKNEMSVLSVKEGLNNIYRQFILIPAEKEEVIAVSGIIETIFRNYPVMKFKNLGDHDSTIILKEAIDQIMENDDEL